MRFLPALVTLAFAAPLAAGSSVLLAGTDDAACTFEAGVVLVKSFVSCGFTDCATVDPAADGTYTATFAWEPTSFVGHHLRLALVLWSAERTTLGWHYETQESDYAFARSPASLTVPAHEEASLACLAARTGNAAWPLYVNAAHPSQPVEYTIRHDP